MIKSSRLTLFCIQYATKAGEEGALGWNKAKQSNQYMKLTVCSGSRCVWWVGLDCSDGYNHGIIILIVSSGPSINAARCKVVAISGSDFYWIT